MQRKDIIVGETYAVWPGGRSKYRATVEAKVLDVIAGGTYTRVLVQGARYFNSAVVEYRIRPVDVKQLWAAEVVEQAAKKAAAEARQAQDAADRVERHNRISALPATFRSRLRGRDIDYLVNGHAIILTLDELERLLADA